MGCATPGNNYDPLEPINRPIYSLNKGVDTVALRPLANTWKTVMPEPVQQGVHNFFENVSDVFAIPAAALQGKFKDAGSSMLRVLANTTLGMAGLFDVASDMEINLREMLKLKKELYDIISNHSGQTYEWVEKASDRDYWMTSTEAKEFGMVDEVLEKKS